jgi:hypothetical protein
MVTLIESLVLIGYGMLLVLLAWWWSRAGLARSSMTTPGDTCAGCRYDLSGLQPNAYCPECGGWRRVDEVPVQCRVPLWVPAAAVLGSVLSNAPAMTILAIGDYWEPKLLMLPVGFAAVLLVSSNLIARLPDKAAVKLAIGIPLATQCSIQTLETVHLIRHPPTGFNSFAGLEPFFAIAIPTLFASFVLGVTSIIGIICVYFKRALNRRRAATRPASALARPAPSHPPSHQSGTGAARSAGGC